MTVSVRRAVDLTVPLDATTQVYPGDPAVAFQPVATVREHGFNLLGVQMGSQSGTSCDAPLHVIDGAAPIDATDLTLWVGPAKVLDVTGLAPRTSITVELIAPQLDGMGPGTIALIRVMLPLRLTGADGSPTRAVALDLG